MDEQSATTPMRSSRMVRYAAFPVYRRAGDSSRIYVPAADGFLAPYRRTTDQP